MSNGSASLARGTTRGGPDPAFPTCGSVPIGCSGQAYGRDVVDTDTVTSLAEALWEAERTRTPIEPLTDGNADLVVADAYAIQTHNIDRRLAAGARTVGRKIGFTSRSMQELLGVDRAGLRGTPRRHDRRGWRRGRPRPP